MMFLLDNLKITSLTLQATTLMQIFIVQKASRVDGGFYHQLAQQVCSCCQSRLKINYTLDFDFSPLLFHHAVLASDAVLWRLHYTTLFICFSF